MMPASGLDGTAETAPMAHTDSDCQDFSMPPNEAAVMSPTEEPAIPLEKVADKDIEAGKSSNLTEFCGLSKEELMQYSNDPFWVRLRWIFFIGFWIVWLGMLAGAIFIIFLGPKCAQKSKLSWWQHDPIYQIYPRSFKDSDADGIGDIRGISSKLGYLESLGVKNVWLSPVYKSPMKDFGYDVSNYREIDPIFGSLEDFDNLVSEMKTRGMHLIMDFVPNHSSDLHDWFVRSAAREDPYTDFYIWADNSTDGGAPNQWQSVFGGSAWTYHEQRGQFYYHQFLAEQPDLNYRSPKVLQRMLDEMKFWLDRGVSGFRLDAVRHLFETANLSAVEPAVAGTAGSTWEQLEHSGVTTDLAESLDILSEFRKLCDSVGGGQVVLLAEVTGASDEQQLEYYGSADSPLVHLPLYTGLSDQLTAPQQLKPSTIEKVVTMRTGSKLPNSAWASWQLGSHDVSRVASRVGAASVDLMHMLTITLPGTPVLYYGDELAMTDVSLTFDQTVDPRGRQCGAERYQQCSRDPQRSPMQWTSGDAAGFSDPSTGVAPWLPVDSSHSSGINVADEEEDVSSHLAVFRRLIQLRSEQLALTDGNFSTLLVNQQIYSYVRQLSDGEGCVIVLNTADTAVSGVDLTSSSTQLPAAGELLLRTSQLSAAAASNSSQLLLNSLSLAAREALLLKIESPE